MEQYYNPSGKFSPLAFLFWILTALIALPILAVVYAYAIWYIPIPYLNFFITAIFGFLIGLVISTLVIKLGKVRNGKLAFVFCLFGALTALYIHWAVWVDLAFNVTDTIGTEDIGIAQSNIKISEVLNLVSQPNGLFSTMGLINEVGVWGIKGGTVSGGFLTFIWIVELLMTTIVALAVGITQASKPFCEEENSWFEENELSPVSHFVDGAGLVKTLASGDIDQLNAVILPVSDTNSESHAKITLYDAKSGENYVSITNEVAKQNEKGEVKFDSEIITSFLKISQDTANRLKASS